MKRLITALLLIAMPVIALGQEIDFERELQKIREQMVWQETVLRGQIQYQIDEMRNRLFIERLFPDVYLPRYEYVLPMLMLPSLELPDLFIPEEDRYEK
jgi:hypothetical protein